MNIITMHKILTYFLYFLGFIFSLSMTWYICKNYIYEKQYGLRFEEKEMTTATVYNVDLSYKFEDSDHNVEEEYFIDYYYFVNGKKYNSYRINEVTTKRGKTYIDEKIKIEYVKINPEFSYVIGEFIDDGFITTFFLIYGFFGWILIGGIWYLIIIDPYLKWKENHLWKY